LFSDRLRIAPHGVLLIAPMPRVRMPSFCWVSFPKSSRTQLFLRDLCENPQRPPRLKLLLSPPPSENFGVIHNDLCDI
jgi:hypothetical protein